MARKHKVFNEEQVKDLLENADRIVFVEKDNRMINGKIADDRVLPLKEELYRRYERFQDDRDEAIVPFDLYVPSYRELHDVETDLSAWVYRSISTEASYGKITKVTAVAW